MKIDKPQGPLAPEALATPEGPDKAGRAKETGFAEKLRGPEAPTDARAPAPPAANDPVATVATDLRAGRITPDQAVNRVVELALERVGGATLPEATRQQMREALQRAVADDPELSAKARRLGADLAALAPDASPAGEDG